MWSSQWSLPLLLLLPPGQGEANGPKTLPCWLSGLAKPSGEDSGKNRLKFSRESPAAPPLAVQHLSCRLGKDPIRPCSKAQILAQRREHVMDLSVCWGQSSSGPKWKERKTYPLSVYWLCLSLVLHPHCPDSFGS